MKQKANILAWILQLGVSVIFCWAAFLKLSSAQVEIDLFTKLDMEPHGRYLIGALEAAAVILLLIPKSTLIGAILTSGIMIGAMIAHATKIGFTGSMLPLTIMAGFVFAASVIIILIRAKDLKLIEHMLAKENKGSNKK